MRASTPVALLLAAALVAGCAADDEGDAPKGADTANSSTSPTPTDDPSPEQPDFTLVERPAYSFNAPEGWEDVTEERTYRDRNTYYGRETINLINAGTLAVDHSSDVPYETIDDNAKSLIESYSVRNAAIKRVDDTTWAGIPAMHALGPGADKGTTFQAFYVIREGDATEILIQTRGGAKAAQKVAHQIESTWEWH